MEATRYLLSLAAQPPAGDLRPHTVDGKDLCEVRTSTSSSACYQGCSSCSAFHTLQIFGSSCITHWSKSIPSLYLFSPSLATQPVRSSNLMADLWLNQGSRAAPELGPPPSHSKTLLLMVCIHDSAWSLLPPPSGRRWHTWGGRRPNTSQLTWDSVLSCWLSALFKGQDCNCFSVSWKLFLSFFAVFLLCLWTSLEQAPAQAVSKLSLLELTTQRVDCHCTALCRQRNVLGWFWNASQSSHAAEIRRQIQLRV